MDKATVYTKTAKGITQVNQRSASLSKDLMKVLKLIDGKSNFGQLLEKADIDKPGLEKALMSLAKDGFARVFETKKEADPFGEPAAEGGGDDFDFTAPNKMPSATQRVMPGAANDISELVRQQAKQDTDRKAREQAHEAARAKAKLEAESRAKLEAEARAKAEAEKKAMEQAQRAKEASERAKAELEAKMHEEETRRKAASEQAARALIEAKKKEEEEGRKLAELKVRAQQEANQRAKAELEQKVREEELRKKIDAESAALAVAAQKERDEAEQRKLAEVRVRAEKEAKALAEARMRAEAEAAALAKQRAEAEAAAQKQAQEAKGAEQEMKARLKDEIEARIRGEMEALLREETEEKSEQSREAMKAEIMAEARLAAKAELEERMREERETLQRAEMEARAKAEKDSNERAEMEAKKRAEAEARAQAESTARIKAEEESRRLRAQAEDQERRLKAQAEDQARQARESDARARIEAESRAKEQQETAARLDAERKAVETERRAKYEAEARAKIDAEESEKRQRELQQTIEAERKGKLEAELRARTEAEMRARSEADTRAAVHAEIEQNVEKRAEIEGKAQAKAFMAAKVKAEEDEDQRMRADQARKAAEIAAILRTKVEREDLAPEGEPAKKRVRRRRKGLLRTVVVALVAGLILGILLLHVIPLRGYAVKVENAMKGWLHDDVSIASLKFSLVPTPHMRVENISVGKLLDAKATNGRIYLDITTIFGGRLGINRIELDNVTLTNEAVRRIPAWGALEGKTEAGEIDTIRLKNVKLDMKPAIDTFDADLSFARNGAFKAAMLRSAGWELGLKPGEAGIDIDLNARNWILPAGGVLIPVSDARLHGTWSGNEIVVPEFEAAAMDGKVNGTLRVTWGSSVKLESELALARVATKELIGAFTKDIAILGRLEGNLSVAAEAADVATLLAAPRAQGKFKVGEGSISNADLVAVMQSDSAGNRAGVTKFAELTGEFVAAEHRISYRNLNLQGGVLRGSGNVDVGASGALAGKVALEIRSQVAQDRGTFTVSGTVSRPMIKRGG